MKFMRWFFMDDTARWRGRANRFLLIGTGLLVLMLVFWLFMRH